MFWAYVGPPIYDNVSALAAVPDQKLVALSFADGPNPPFTEQLLGVLAEEGVPATFFMTGKHVEQYPETVARVIDAGDAVENHGWNEEDLATMPPERVRRSLARTEGYRFVGIGEGGAL